MTKSEPGPLSKLTPSFIRRSYTVKFVVSILLVVIVIASVGMVSYVQARDTVQEDTSESLRSTVEIHAGDVSEYVRDKRSKAASLAASNTVATGNPAEVRGVIQERNQQWGLGIVGVYVVDIESETIVAQTTVTDMGTEAQQPMSDFDTPWADPGVYEDLDEGTRTLDRGFRSPVNDQFAMATVARTVVGSRAIVVVSEMESLMTELPQPVGGSTTVISDADTPVASVSRTDGETVLNASGGAALGSRPASSFAVGPDDEDGTAVDTTADRRVYAIATLDIAPEVSWTVVTSVPKSEAFGVVNSVGRSVGLIIALALLSLGAVGLVLGRQTVTPLSELRRKVERMEEGDLDVDLTTTRQDEIGRLYSGFGSMRDSLQERIREIQETNRHLERKADEYSQVMRACADGDLTRRMEPDDRNESMNEIAREFNTMIEELEETTERIKNFAYEVAISSQEVTASADLVNDASGQVTDSVLEINEGAERQNDRLAEITEDLNTLSQTTDEIATSSNEVALVARETVETGREGREAAQEAIDDMDRVTDESEAAVDEIRQLERETEQIDELLEFINEIAQRTNMLALNANIEANRTAEGGDESGFGVIANEIKQLSEEAQQATENIEQRLQRIQVQTSDAAEVVEETSREVQSSATNVRDAVRALEEITEYAEATNDGIQSISQANEAQVGSTAEVAEQVEAVAEISTQTSRESETVAALAEEQTDATTRMSESAGSLNQRAQQLSETLDDFETDADVAPETAGAVDSEPATGADFGGGSAVFAPDEGDDAVGFSPEAAGDASANGGGEDGDDGAAVFSPGTEDGDGGEDGDGAMFSPEIEDEG
jgi:methyl-accepting chemotaxis protein